MTSKLTREHATDTEIQMLIDSHEKGTAMFMRKDAYYFMAKELQERRKAERDSEPVAWMHSNNDIGIPAITVSQKIGHYWMAEFENVQPLYRHAQPAPEREKVRREHAEWSQATFGNVGPVGPLKHLSKEALEAAAEPDDLSEWADMQFLLWDAQRRAGITDEQITQAMIEKLAVNKLRDWPEPKDGEPRLHIKEQPALVIPDVISLEKVAEMTAARGAEYSIRDGIIAAKWWNACRAAMLDRQLVDHVDEESLTSINPAPAMGSLSKTGEVLHTNSPAQGGNSSVIPDTWIPASERMPETDGNYWGWWSESKRQGPVWFIKSELQAQFQSHEITHWMPLPVAPQEVKGE